jgi:hypothetical protein
MPLQTLAEMSNNGNIHETAKIDIKVKNRANKKKINRNSLLIYF